MGCNPLVPSDYRLAPAVTARVMGVVLVLIAVMVFAATAAVAFLDLHTAVLLVPLAQRLKLDAVLGYLIGGCLIGPWGLGLIHEVERISQVAEIGVVLMLFLIGLELEPRKLLAMRTIVLGGGTGPATDAPVRTTVSTILRAELSMTSWS